MWTAFETSSKFLWPPMKRSRVKVSCVKAPLDILSTSGWSSTSRKPLRWVRKNLITCQRLREIGWVLLQQRASRYGFTSQRASQQYNASMLEAKRDLHKSRPPSTSNFQCQICQRMCRLRIGPLAKSYSWCWDSSLRRLSPSGTSQRTLCENSSTVVCIQQAYPDDKISDDCLKDKTEDLQNCSVLYCVLQLCIAVWTLMRAILPVNKVLLVYV